MARARKFLEEQHMSAYDVIAYIAALPMIDSDMLDRVVELSDKQENKLVIAGTKVLELIDFLAKDHWGPSPEYRHRSRTGVLSEMKFALRHVYMIYWKTSVGSGIAPKKTLPTKRQWRDLADQAIMRVIKEYRDE